jgi:hypothetical protein
MMDGRLVAILELRGSPIAGLLIGVGCIAVAVAVARWWRPIARHIRRANAGSSGAPVERALDRLYGTEDEPRGTFLFFWAVLLCAGGCLAIVTSLLKLLR